MQPFQARLARKRTSFPRTRLAPPNPVVSPRICCNMCPHGDSQAREQDRTEGQASVVLYPELSPAQHLSLSLAFFQEDCPLRPVTQGRGWHADWMMSLRRGRVTENVIVAFSLLCPCAAKVSQKGMVSLTAET